MPTSIYDINRIHNVDHDYFEKINTQEKAYWLGFLWADGSISKTASRSSGKNRMQLSQKADNVEHLKLFANAIKAPANIRYSIGTYNGQPVANLSINSRKFCIHLERLGFDIKSRRIHMPKMSTSLYRHFIRRYFDGDECLSVYVQTSQKTSVNRQEFSLTGNETLMLEIQQILNEQTTVSKRVHVKHYKRTNKAVSLRYGRKADIAALEHYLYDKATVYLKEKHDKFIEFNSRQF